MGVDQVVFEYSEVGVPAQDAALALVTKEAALALSDILKRSGVEWIRVQPKESVEALASEGE
jgi:hypothetical protein